MEEGSELMMHRTRRHVNPFGAPEVWIRLTPSHEVDLTEFDDEDATEILKGDKRVYSIVIIQQRTEENWNSPADWNILEDCDRYIGRPGLDRVYESPKYIADQWIRYYAMDMWVGSFGFKTGDRVMTTKGDFYEVIALEYEEDDEARGAYTGAVVCTEHKDGMKVRRSVPIEWLKKAGVWITKDERN
ncbi:hypothetical protein ABZ543_13330 [Streptomyces roseifaciens]